MRLFKVSSQARLPACIYDCIRSFSNVAECWSYTYNDTCILCDPLCRMSRYGSGLDTSLLTAEQREIVGRAAFAHDRLGSFTAYILGYVHAIRALTQVHSSTRSFSVSSMSSFAFGT
jgi:hypothetical protein